jgi:hypothetical protein
MFSFMSCLLAVSVAQATPPPSDAPVASPPDKQELASSTGITLQEAHRRLVVFEQLKDLERDGRLVAGGLSAFNALSFGALAVGAFQSTSESAQGVKWYATGFAVGSAAMSLPLLLMPSETERAYDAYASGLNAKQDPNTLVEAADVHMRKLEEHARWSRLFIQILGGVYAAGGAGIIVAGEMAPTADPELRLFTRTAGAAFAIQGLGLAILGGMLTTPHERMIRIWRGGPTIVNPELSVAPSEKGGLQGAFGFRF